MSGSDDGGDDEDMDEYGSQDDVEDDEYGEQQQMPNQQF